MRHGIAHATGQTGYQERSRAAGAASSSNRSVNPSIVYLKSQAPGSGTLQAADDVDPRSQSEQFVKRVAGPAELAWSQQRMNEYQKRREMLLKVANFRHELLKKVVAEDAGKDASLREEILKNFKSRMDGDLVRSLATPEDIKNYLLFTASPEEIATCLPQKIVREDIEGQVKNLREALFQDYSATLQN